MFENADLIHRYTRADALRDGVLIDVSAAAREAGIRWPLALTAAAWANCVAVPAGAVCWDEAGRRPGAGALRLPSGSSLAASAQPAPDRADALQRFFAPAPWWAVLV
jgi:hypothetical protein